MEFKGKDLKKIKELTISEFTTSKNASSQKRQTMRDRTWLYNVSNVADEKVKVNLIRSLTNSLLALYYQDKLSIKWTSRDLYHFIEASNFQSVCEYDYDNLSMEKADYTNQKNRFTKWVWIRLLDGWDDRQDYKNPSYKVVAPESWYPDPSGHTSAENFQYMGFERIMSVQEVKANSDIWMNTWKVEAWLSPDMQEKIESDASPRDMTALEKELWWSNTVIYVHYSRYKGLPIQVTMRGASELLDVRVVEPLIRKVKGKTEVLKWIPVSLNYYEPVDWDPRGICLYDIAEDKQKLKTLMYNLIRVQAIKQALWGKVFLDKSIYFKSKKILEQWVQWPQYIPVDIKNNANIGNMMYNEPVQGMTQDVYNFPQLLDQQVQDDTGLSSLTRWVADPNADTAREAQIAQMNANINLILWNKINSRWEKDFWELWYLYYKFYFSAKDEKYTELNRGIWQSWDIFSRKNIIGANDPRLQIQNKWELESKNKSELATFERIYTLTLNDPTTPPVARRFMKRKLYAMQWMSLREIEQWCPYTPEELDAKDHVILLNNNMPVIIEDPNEDHYTYLCIYQSALSTPATKSAIEMRKMAYIQSWQQELMNQAWPNQAMQNHASRQSLSQQPQNWPQPLLNNY